jgi:hypothetical protein
MRITNVCEPASRVILRRLLIVAAVLLAAGCIPSGRVSGGTPFPNEVLWDNPCQLPCWHHIVPGETTKDTAKEIVQGLDFVETASVRERTDEDAERTWLTWDARSPYTGNGSIGLIDGVVESIVVEGRFDATLSQLVECYGPPERYQVDASGGGMAAIWEYDFHHPERGAMFEAAHQAYPGKNSPAPVYAEAEVWRMGLLEAGTLEEQIERRFGEYPPLRPLHRWHGFDPLPSPTPMTGK